MGFNPVTDLCKTSEKERMKDLFNVIDWLKADLNKAKKFESVSDGLVAGENRWTFLNGTLRRNNKKISGRLIVTDFYHQYFPDAGTVLYRIELKHAEQIRGYIFLKGMAKPGGAK
jgi:hypothetical protein